MRRSPPTTPVYERLWNKVDTSGDCWLYQGGSRVSGGHRQLYSHFEGTKRIQKLAHRLVWEYEHGPVPDGLELRHTCNTPNCVRPGHVLLGTNQQNEQDKDPFRLPHDKRRTVTTFFADRTLTRCQGWPQ